MVPRNKIAQKYGNNLPSEIYHLVVFVLRGNINKCHCFIKGVNKNLEGCDDDVGGDKCFGQLLICTGKKNQCYHGNDVNAIKYHHGFFFFI